MTRTVPQKIEKQRSDWWQAHVIWSTLHWGLTAGAIIFGALAALFKQHAPLFGSLAALSSTFIGAAYPLKRANGYERAQALLQNACIAYECSDSFSIDDLLKKNDEAQNIISETSKIK